MKFLCTAPLVLPTATAFFVATSNSRSPFLFANVLDEALPATVVDQLDVSSAKQYAEQFGLGTQEAGFYGLFRAMRSLALGLEGYPFVIRQAQLEQRMGEPLFSDFFNMQDLEKALEDDFLDAARGSTDNRKAWKVSS